jgi:peptidyl-Asp metalloendopeptidase
VALSKGVRLVIAIAVGVLKLAYGDICRAAEAEERPGIFSALPDSLTMQAKDQAIDPTVSRARFVTVDWNAVNDMDATSQRQTAGESGLMLNLFDDAIFRAVLDRREVRSKSVIWLGHIEGIDKSQVTLVIEDAVMAGNIRLPGAYFQVRYVGPGLHSLRQIDESHFPPEGQPIPTDTVRSETAQDSGIAATDDGSRFDVLVVYTPAARAAAGGTTAMGALINLAVAETNTAYSRSAVIPRLRLVHQEEVSYTESGDFSTDLNRLTNPSDGFMDNVHALRNAHGADLVSLIIEGASLCGLAWLMLTESNSFQASAFSVVARICATGNFSFGHELGHNMGLQHDRADAPADGVFSFSHGYVDTPHGFRDIMGVAASCGGCMRIQNFSNPNLMFNNFPTGVPQSSPQSADAAASLNATAFTVANWRSEVAAGTIVSAVLPSSRSVQVGTTATAFATIINAGSVTATACGISLITSLSATFTYQTTNPATNQVTGAPNTPANIAAGAAQSYVFALTPSALVAPTDVQLGFDCTNSDLAPITTGLNTLLLSASATPVPDMVALAATPSNDGIVNIPGATGTGAFAAATVNVGANGSITALADTGAASLPLTVSLCETNPATGQCISGIGSTVTTTINTNATPTFGIFVQASANVAFDPALNRIFVRFKDSDAVTRGSTSVAVRTQ